MRFTKNIFISLMFLFGIGAAGALLSIPNTVSAACESGADCIREAQANSSGAKKFFELLGTGVTFLAAGVGIVVTAMIIVGGIQYTAANGDPSKVTAAKSKIYNALFALIAFIFLWAFLQWLVPGGVFS